MEQSDAYPVTYDVDYPDRNLNRGSTFFRILLIIPIAVLQALVSGMNGLFFFPLLMILFRQKYPRWIFDFNVAVLRFTARVTAYGTLLRDEYPSTDEEQAVHLDIPYPDAQKDLTPWYPLVKWLLAIPHYIVLALLTVAALVVVIVAWFAILFTGQYPRDLFNFVVGVQRWWTRVIAYAFTLATDEYPPFRLGA